MVRRRINVYCQLPLVAVSAQIEQYKLLLQQTPTEVLQIDIIHPKY